MPEFTEKEKRIFKYWNGEKEIYADPFRIQRRYDAEMINQTYDMRSAFEQMEEKDKEGNERPFNIRSDAIEKIIPFIHKVFGTKPIDPEDGSGVDEDMAILNLSNWFEWSNEVKKNTESSPNSPLPTQDSAEQSNPTNNTSECGPTSPESLESTLSQ